MTLLLVASLAQSSVAEQIDVFLITGQSNGGNVGELNSYDPQGYFNFNADNAVRTEQGFRLDFARIFDRPTNNPNSADDVVFHSFSNTQLDPCQFATDRLAVELNQLSGNRIAVFSFCRNGRPLHNDQNNEVDGGTSWYPGDDPANGFVYDEELYGAFRVWTLERIAELEAQGHTVTVKAAFWFQGESDTGLVDANNYEANFENLVERMRLDFSDDLVVVGTKIREIPNRFNFEGQQIVNIALENAAANDPRVEVVETQDLQPLDANNLHFQRGAYYILANRWSSAFERATIDPVSKQGQTLFNGDPGTGCFGSNLNLINNFGNDLPFVSGTVGAITIERNGVSTKNQGIASQDNINSLLTACNRNVLAETDTVTLTFDFASVGDIANNGMEFGISPNGTGFRPAGNLFFMIDDGGGLSGISGANALGLADDAGFGITEQSLSDGFTATLTADVNGFTFTIDNVILTEVVGDSITPTDATTGSYSGVFTGTQFLDIFSTGHIYTTIQQATPNVLSEFSIVVNDPSTVGLIGDFDDDNDVDVDDINFYSGNIGSAAVGVLVQLDLTGDGQITFADLQAHVETYVQTSNGQTGTFLGDVNLDGSVDVLGDAFTLIGNLNNPAAVYAQGDLNLDGRVDVLSDAFLLIGNLGKSNAASTAKQ